jgi:hypothetical protein
VTETPEEFRQRAEKIDSKFFEDFEKRGGPFRERSFEYEKLAADYSHKGFQTLTYLNGGALVAIPTAMAFFRAEVTRVDVMWTAAAFILGLFCVVLAQIAAFFTMAKRAEAQEFFRNEQFERVAALMYQHQTELNIERQTSADTHRSAGNRRLRHSNRWRLIGLSFFVVSLIAFVAGCVEGARAVLIAKERPELNAPSRGP